MENKVPKKDTSKSFCILPWIHLNVMPNSTVIPCCISPYDDLYGNGAEQSFNEIWNSDKFKTLRKKMLLGEEIIGCSRCHNLESSGFKSMRQEMNQFFKKYIPFAEETKEDGSVDQLTLKYIDVRFSNLCNFKCRSCGPSLSSAWFEDYQNLFKFKSNENKVRSVSVSAPNFWIELKSLIPHADVIYFGGGEPLITREHYEILSQLNSLSRFDIELRYTTNLSQLNYGNYDLAEYWKKFKRVQLSVSIDDIGSRAEYFRHGTNWKIIEKNIQTLKTKHPAILRSVNCTVNIMNVLYLPEIYEYLMDNEVIGPEDFNINLLLDPYEMRIDALSMKLKEKVTVRLKKFKFKLSCHGNKFNAMMKDIDNILAFMNKTDNSHYLNLFKHNTLELDRLRGENFINVFPELESLIN